MGPASRVACVRIPRFPIGAVWANVVGFGITVVGNSWANRRWTFQHRRDSQRWRRRLVTLLLLACSLVAASLAVSAVRDDAIPQMIVLTATWVAAAIVRFMPLRSLLNRSTSSDDHPRR